ncbi:MAG: DDE-type integrase/transposase/recombinase [Candidatus Jordarchaeaceae archaeon]
MRAVRDHIRAHYDLPISTATILRQIIFSVYEVEMAITFFLREGIRGFRLRLGDVWEIDELYVACKNQRFPLIIVRDLRTGFDVGTYLARSTSSENIKIALKKAKEIAHACPSELRCDGLRSYDDAVREVFGDNTRLLRYRRVGNMGQNQSIEGHNSVIRSRLKIMRCLHSYDKSRFIVNGLILHYNYVRTSQVLGERAPIELAMEQLDPDYKHSWLWLLKQVSYYRTMHQNPCNYSRVFKKELRLDHFMF